MVEARVSHPRPLGTRGAAGAARSAVASNRTRSAVVLALEAGESVRIPQHCIVDDVHCSGNQYASPHLVGA